MTNNRGQSGNKNKLIAIPLYPADYVGDKGDKSDGSDFPQPVKFPNLRSLSFS